MKFKLCFSLVIFWLVLPVYAELDSSNRIQEVWDFEAGGQACQSDQYTSCIHVTSCHIRNAREDFAPCMQNSGSPFKAWTLSPRVLDQETTDIIINEMGYVLKDGDWVYKIDVNVPDLTTENQSAVNVYFQIATPSRYPNYNRLEMKADLFIEEKPQDGAYVSVGNYNRFLSYPFSGGGTRYYYTQTGEWIHHYMDLVETADAAEERDLSSLYPDISGADVASETDRFGVVLQSSSPGRFIIYLNNIEFSGDIPDRSAYAEYGETLYQNYLSRVQYYRDSIEASVALFNDDRDYLLSQNTDSGFSDLVNEIYDIDKGEESVWNSIAVKLDDSEVIFSKAEYDHIDRYTKAREHLFNLADYLNENTEKDIVMFPWEAMGSKKIVINTFPVLSDPAEQLPKVIIAPGETESLSFVLRSQKEIENIMIQAGDFEHAIKPEHKILAEAIDIRLVKSWYQAAEDTLLVKNRKKVLVPELLLKNDDLVRVSLEEQSNELLLDTSDGRIYHDISSYNSLMPYDATIDDAESLQSFSMAEFTNKQIWVNIKIPEGQTAGRYLGNIVVAYNDSYSTYPLEVIVLPTELTKPEIDYSLYYYGVIPQTYSQEDCYFSEGLRYNACPNRYEQEIINMREHGIDYPGFVNNDRNTGFDDPIATRLQIMRDSGMPTDKIFAHTTELVPRTLKAVYCDSNTDSDCETTCVADTNGLLTCKDQNNQACTFDIQDIDFAMSNPIDQLCEDDRTEVISRIEFGRIWKGRVEQEFGTDTQFYVYGIDEAKEPQKLAIEKMMFQFYHHDEDGNFKTFVSVSNGVADNLAGYVDLVNYQSERIEQEADATVSELNKWRNYDTAKGGWVSDAEIYTYANPQSGIEDPLLYRRNFGLYLVKNGFDGAMTFNYQMASSDVIRVRDTRANLASQYPDAIEEYECEGITCYRTTGDLFQLTSSKTVYTVDISTNQKGYYYINTAQKGGYASSWNDFDTSLGKLRDHVFAYPATNGVIDTIQWEGFREGVDDVRYYQTLKNLIAQNPDTEIALNAQEYLDDIISKQSLQEYPQAIRNEMILRILQLQSMDSAIQADTDSDGMNDAHEFATGTDPLNSDSDNDGMEDGWEIEYGLNPLHNEDASMDSDGDGLTNLQESKEGTDPFNADTDRDGMPDKWEVSNELNPNNCQDADWDEDKDGLTNLNEFLSHTNPLVKDTDEDDYEDGIDYYPLDSELHHYLQTVEAGKWIKIVDSKMRDVMPNPLPGYLSTYSFYNSGGVYDSMGNRLIVWGGGDNSGYWGNELYAFDISTMSWSRLTDASTEADVKTFNECSEADPLAYYADCRPRARETWDSLVFIPEYGESGSVCAIGARYPYIWHGYNVGTTSMDCFDLADNQWIKKPNAPVIARISAYDPVTGWVFVHKGATNAGFLRSLDPVANSGDGQWYENGVIYSGPSWVGAMNMVVDQDTRKLIAIGSGMAEIWNISEFEPITNNNFDPSLIQVGAEQLSQSGGEELINSKGPGLTYDSNHNRIVGWAGGINLHQLIYNQVTGSYSWGVIEPASVPDFGYIQKAGNVTFGRFQYIPDIDGFILVNSPEEDVYFFKSH